MKILTSVLLALCFSLTNYAQENKFEILDAGYTYWWPSGGPFIGNKYSMAFIGTVKKLHQPFKEEGMLYTSQKGMIQIDEILTKKSPDATYKSTAERSYMGVKEPSYFSSDCFFDSGLNEEDKIIAFVYSYEGYYSIPGGSILKVKDLNDPIVVSIKKYIENDQNPLSIQSDMGLWSRYGFGDQLKEAIDRRKFSIEAQK